MSELTVSTPGRICLFGEHQDYLELPVIAAAISLRMTVFGRQTAGGEIHVDLPDVKSAERFSIHGELPYTKERDYFRSAVNVLRRHGMTFSSGLACRVLSEIPISAGTSSSTALVVSWINLLSRMCDEPVDLTAEQCARYAHEAEVGEFLEPGGMMDHYSTALGGTVFLSFVPALSIEKLAGPSGSFVIGDSREPKNTRVVLSRVRNNVATIVRRIRARHKDFVLLNTGTSDLPRFRELLDPEEYAFLAGTVRNHEITREALAVLRGKQPDGRQIGKLLVEHQTILRDILKISTPKIDRMVEAALENGALGAKINGSGGGGCMFAYAPGNAEAVAESIKRVGGKSYIVSIDTGTRLDQNIAHS